MCVAVIIASKKRVPTDHLKAMHEANSDGAGIAWYDKGRVVMFRKGMTWQEIDAIQDRLPRPFLLHFRIATRGAKIPELTHPFPIGMQAFTEDLTGVAEKGVIIHNGTWPDYHKYVPEGIKVSEVSDTQVAAYAVDAVGEEILKEVRWSNVIMTTEKLVYRGSWTEENGNYYSNMHWKRELDWEQYKQTWKSRTTTYIPEPRKKAHQENRSQEGGRTVTGKYQTQYSKSGKGVHTVQGNGKTIQENREAKKVKRKQSPVENDNHYSGGDPYDNALRGYRQSIGLKEDKHTNLRGNDWESDTTPLFDADEIPSYMRLSDGKQPTIHTALGTVRTKTVDLGKYDRPSDVDRFLGPSVKCPDCKEEITQIPCVCGMNSDEELEQALAALDDEGNFNADVVEVPAGGMQDLADVEDMNAYGENGDAYLNPDFAEVQKAIQADAVPMKGESTEGEDEGYHYFWE